MIRRVSLAAALVAIAATAAATSPAAAQDPELDAAAAPQIVATQLLTTRVDPGSTFAAGQVRVWVRDDGALAVNVPARTAEPPIPGYQVCARIQNDPTEPFNNDFGQCVGWLRAGTVSTSGTDAVFDVPIKVLASSPVAGAGAKTIEVFVRDAGGETTTATLGGFEVGALATGQTLNFYHLQNEGGPNLAWVGSTKSGLAYTQNGTPLTLNNDPGATTNPGGHYRNTGFVLDALGGANTFRANGDATGFTIVGESPLVAPTVSIASGIPASNIVAPGSTVSVTLSASEAASTYWYKLNNGNWTPSASATVNLGALANGSYTLRVAVNDGAGFASAAVSRNFAVGSSSPPQPGSAGYLIAAESGTIVPFGTARAEAINGTATHAAAVVDVVYHPNRTGYWTLDVNGVVISYGAAATFEGASTNVPRASWRSGERAVALSTTPSGNGYWVFTSAGRVLRFGDAGALEDLLAIPLQGAIVDAAPAVGEPGVYLVASDGGVFALSATFHGSVRGALGGGFPAKPIRAILPQAGGYMMVAEDGGVFAFGTTVFRGSLPGLNVTPNRPIASIVTNGPGYLLVGEDGGVFAFNTPFAGSLGGTATNERFVSIAAA
jgi:hypothetical protein